MSWALDNAPPRPGFNQDPGGPDRPIPPGPGGRIPLPPNKDEPPPTKPPGGKYGGYPGDPASNYRAFFEWLTQDKPHTPAFLESLTAVLLEAGIKVLKNAKGVAGKIQLPNGKVIDVLIGADAGGQGWAWQEGDDAAVRPLDTRADPSQNPYFRDFADPFGSHPYQQPPPFAYPGFVPPTAESVQAEPGYALGLRSGEGAIQNSAASRGSYFTPNTFRGLDQFATDYAATKYGDAYGRALTTFGQGYGQAKDIYDTNTAIGMAAYNTNYANRWQQYLTQISTFFGNQDRTWNRNFSMAQLGQAAASAGG